MSTKILSSRKGITPVIAIVLLVMMAVGIAGGAFVWITRFSEQAQEKTGEEIGKNVDVKDIKCINESGGNGSVIITVSNNGDKEIDMVPAHLYVYSISTGDIEADLSNEKVNDSNNPAFESTIEEPGNFKTIPIKAGGEFESDKLYRIEIEFPDDAYQGLSGRCRAEEE